MRRATEKRMNLVALILLGTSVAMALTLLIVPASTHGPRDLIAEGMVSIAPDPSGDVVVPHAHAFVDNGTLLVKGTVRCDVCAVLTQKRTLNVTLLSPAGLSLDQASCQCGSSVDPSRPQGPFSVRLKTIPPTGSRIQVRCQVSEPIGKVGSQSAGGNG